ncbi:Tm-1-like ATP-binding domain-containing protein [Desulfobacula sp.]|uniref:Tm-1-like ATP-binding domain-containing protein n=1 Tax=Desulfobacula sp. TaxID=2593537 RepID=UPI002625817D|nr:Tm-1-like ATP-binding domain-containing protein [Desulfobacula sp.]
MEKTAAIAILGTFDSKGDEHLFLKERIEKRGHTTLTVNVGIKNTLSFPVDVDLYSEMRKNRALSSQDRDKAIAAMISHARELVKNLYGKGALSGIISAGGGSGTHLCTRVMQVLPLGIPKVMISTVASRDMAGIVGTKDITMMHSVVDLLGINSVSGNVLDKAAAAICGMAESRWKPRHKKKRIALTFFGFITRAAEKVKETLEKMDYEVVPFHANGTGGMAMVELASEGYFHGILDLATHELADNLLNGYCGGIGSERYEPIPGKELPRLIVPGGMDCAVLEFTRNTVPEQYRDRKLFFYDFRSAIRLSKDETTHLAKQLSEKLNMDAANVHVLIPTRGFSDADRVDAPLYDPATGQIFIDTLKRNLDRLIEIQETDLHINDPAFGEQAASLMDKLIKKAEAP